MKHYKSIDSIPIWNYNKWLETNLDSRYLLKLEDYDELPEISEKEQSELQNWGNIIYYEAAEMEMSLSKRNSLIFDYTKRLVKMEADYNITKNIIELLKLSGAEPEAEKLLNDIGYSIRQGKEFKDELKRIFNQNQNKKVKIKELKGEIEAMTKSTGEPQSIESIQIALERHNNFAVDLQKTSLKKWIILKNDLVQEIERQQLKKK